MKMHRSKFKHCRVRFLVAVLGVTAVAIPSVQAQDTAGPEARTVDVPAARRSPRATLGTFLDAMNADPDNENEVAIAVNLNSARGKSME